MVKYGATKRAEAYGLLSVGWSCSMVAKQVGVRLSTIKKWRKMIKESPELFIQGPRHHRKGNPKANRVHPPLDKRAKRHVVSYVERRHADTPKREKRPGLRRLSAELATLEHDAVHVSPATISKLCKADGVLPKHMAKKPHYSFKQRRKRLRFSRDHLADDWSTTLAADEVDVSIDGSINTHNNIQWTRKPQADTQRSTKFPVSNKYFIAISAHGALEPFRYTGTLTAERYQQMLDQALVGANGLFGGHEWRYLHDGASYHTAASTQLYLETAVPSFFTKDEWPVCPDGNPAESVFSPVQDAVARAAPRNADELDRVFRAAFRAETTPEKLQRLFDNASMRRRFQAIIDAKGHATHY